MPNVFRRVQDSPSGPQLIFACPGCSCAHGVWTAGPTVWKWNGDLDKPTITPSLKVSCVELPENADFSNVPIGTRQPLAKDTICHSTITDGLITFCGDCTHHLVNQTVPLQEF